MRRQQTVRLTQDGISKLVEGKPVVYTIHSHTGKLNYAGLAKRGRVQERISEHRPNGPDALPGVKVTIEPMDNLPAAKARLKNIIYTQMPTYNKQGK